ncbi:Imm8 family immunity protein [Gordonia polyisoprenivorans]|uniref:Imm8 family immunity protein n=1 Tax=Gordonia polyisoprenivorans TaxID=84595 RepID=UPI001AD7C506|nr:immunity 8 family protein [Gordonia polyisoprenivorans]
MKAEIKSWYSTNVDVTTYQSQDPDSDAVWVRILCGPPGEPGEESFDILVCTPDSLKPELETGGPLIGRHILLQSRLDLAAAYKFVDEYVCGVEGEDWTEVAEKIARVGKWEFEDYRT